MDPDNVVRLPTDEVRGLQNRIIALQDQLADRDLQLITARTLLRVQAEGSTPPAEDPPPPELVHAIRSASASQHQAVWVTVRDAPMLVMVDGKGRPPDPKREAEVWRCLRSLHESA